MLKVLFDGFLVILIEIVNDICVFVFQQLLFCFRYKVCYNKEKENWGVNLIGVEKGGWIRLVVVVFFQLEVGLY